MDDIPTSPCPIGLVVNEVVAARVKALVDEYGAACARDELKDDRRRRLALVLRSVLRSLRLEAVEGDRYRVVRRGDVIELERKHTGKDASSACGVRP